ncbi:MAG: hypothetical protein V2B20_10485 [Pseudomonadota bacterium]
MSMLSDVDVEKYLGKEIVIEPFSKKLLTPIGYDFTIGNFVFCLEHGLLKPTNGSYDFPAKSTLQILTNESLWVSERIGGTFHSKVSLVSKGFSHISTTLDPGWYGPLLITIRNNTKNTISMEIGSAFVTLIFSKLNSPTNTPHFKPAFRKDILLNQLEHKTDEYFIKIASLLGNDNILDEFKNKVSLANKPMSLKVWTSLINVRWLLFFNYLLTFIAILAVGSLLSLQFYWEKVKPLFHNIEYDSKIFSFQIPAAIALIALIISIKKK